jgi:TPR repeat protein
MVSDDDPPIKYEELLMRIEKILPKLSRKDREALMKKFSLPNSGDSSRDQTKTNFNLGICHAYGEGVPQDKEKESLDELRSECNAEE